MIRRQLFIGTLAAAACGAVAAESYPTGPVRMVVPFPAGGGVDSMGRIVAQKAPLAFVRMCARVRERRPETAFVMVGDATLESASLEEETRREAERLGVPIHFTGYRADAPRLAASFDVYVVPSRYEGLGRAVTEAMASGRPVVATAVNGVPDLVEPGATGLLARPGDPESLAAAVVWLLDNPEQARRMGRQGREIVRRHFGQSVMCDALDAVYRELLGLPDRTATPAVVEPVVPNGVPVRSRVSA